jgi:hypothetical protein
MRKLRLDVESLDVESFTVQPPMPRGRGTVEGANAGGIIDKDPVQTYDVGCTYAYDCPIGTGGTGVQTMNGYQTCGDACMTYGGSECASMYVTQCEATCFTCTG